VTFDQNVLWVSWNHSQKITSTDVERLFERLTEVAGTYCPPMLLKLNDVTILTRKAQRQLATELNVAALALVGPTPVDKALARHFTEVHKPPFPTRYFTSTYDAQMWITTDPYSPWDIRETRDSPKRGS
jgi:hypothetical protein